MQVRPIILEGQVVRLEPLSGGHEPALWEMAQEREIWTYMSILVEQRTDFAQWMDAALGAAARGEHIPFAIVDRSTGRAIGSTRYFAIMPADRNLEIGHTWLGKPYWRTAVNTECKYLLLRHAFETLGHAGGYGPGRPDVREPLGGLRHRPVHHLRWRPRDALIAVCSEVEPRLPRHINAWNWSSQ